MAPKIPHEVRTLQKGAWYEVVELVVRRKSQRDHQAQIGSCLDTLLEEQALGGHSEVAAYTVVRIGIQETVQRETFEALPGMRDRKGCDQKGLQTVQDDHLDKGVLGTTVEVRGYATVEMT